MRIIAGEMRGRRLIAPKGVRVRPTLDRVREALFSIFAPWGDTVVLDLFSGTGAIALEAISRGATSAIAVDNAPASLACIRENKKNLDAEDKLRVLRLELPKQLGRIQGRFDFIYLDPPYEGDLGPATLAALAESALPNESSTIVYEHSRSEEPILPPTGLEATGRRQYGDTVLSLFRKAQ